MTGQAGLEDVRFQSDFFNSTLCERTLSAQPFTPSLSHSLIKQNKPTGDFWDQTWPAGRGTLVKNCLYNQWFSSDLVECKTSILLQSLVDFLAMRATADVRAYHQAKSGRCAYLCSMTSLESFSVQKHMLNGCYAGKMRSAHTRSWAITVLLRRRFMPDGAIGEQSEKCELRFEQTEPDRRMRRRGGGGGRRGVSVK